MPKDSCKLLSVGLLLCAWCSAFSAGTTSRFSVVNWPEGSGLPQTSIFSVVQTRDGYLWVGTANGLARFDGLRFTTFDEGNVPGLGSSKIVKLFEDSHTNLWIGTGTAGILVVDAQGKLTPVSTDPTINEGPLSAICEDPSGGVWFTMGQGQLYYWREGRAHKMVNEGCRWLAADDSGLIWTTSRDGRLKALRRVSNTQPWTFVVEHDVLVRDIRYLLPSRQGGFWCLAKGQIDRWKGDHSVRSLGSYPWNPLHPVNAACEDPQNNLVVGVGGEGIFWFDAAGHWEQISKENGLSQETPLSLCFDRQGNLWAGTDGGGLNRVKHQLFEVLEASREWGAKSICADGRGGLWFGCWGQGAKLMNVTNGVIESFGEAQGLKNLDVGVASIFVDRNQKVWAGTAGGNLLRLENGVFEPFFGLPGNVSALYQDQKGQLWAGTVAGLLRWDGESPERFTMNEGLTANDIRAIAEDKEGNLWVGTERGGLDRIGTDGALKRFGKPEDLPSDNIRALYVDAEDVLWVGTSSGLARFKNGQWFSYAGGRGVPRGNVGYLLEDAEGFLWMGSYTGLLRARKKDLDDLASGVRDSVVVRAYGGVDGLPSAECLQGSQPAACRASNGRLWFPTKDGVVSVDPRMLRENELPPPVLLESILIDEKGTNKLRAPVPKSITVPADAESLVIHFTSLNLSAPDKGTFKYRMEGQDKRWTVLPGTERAVRYPKLPHGYYNFHVKAYNEDGIGNEEGVSLAITVLPPFWQTWWFITGVTLLLLGGIVGSVHYVSTQKLQRQLAALRQQEALEQERARIARDLHDQLGANLTQVALLGELAETDKDVPAEVEAHARQISHTARETTRALDEIVWTVNPSNDTLDGLINYICKYAQEYLAMAGLRYRLEVPSQLPPTPISPELRHNVFLAAKEAVNNVVKHSKASEAWLRLHLEPGRFTLEIEDNGRGLSPAAEKKGRNGLRNMRQRMEAVGGGFEVVNGADKGTKVRLTAPLTASDS